MSIIKTFEGFKPNDNLVIVDVQRSFSEFFTQNYIKELSKHCEKFKNVYLIWDNHHEVKVDKDYLYNNSPEESEVDDFYDFPNLKEKIEKRYNYDVDVTFYKKILDSDVYNKILNLEKSNKIKRGDIFPTNAGTAIVYIGNNHKWFHIGKKLFNFLLKFKGKEVELVGGSRNECLLDIEIASRSIGVIPKINKLYTYSANHCYF